MYLYDQDWDVPFAPGTQYQICMWDKNGVPGGCQAMYTVVQNSTVATPTCQNVTFPTQLDVAATVPGGPMSQYGFITQCTDLYVTPKSGKPPFTLTVAPALHPPYNITSDSMDPIDWTVSLSWSFPFFLSLQSSDGQLWSNGPLHAGGFGSSDCLAPGTIPNSQAHAVAAGAGIGGAFGAAILGALGTFLYLRSRKQPAQIEAFDPEARDDPPRSDSQASSWRTSDVPRSRTYVLHHDAGQAPVTVITDASEVVELPPRYVHDSNARSLPTVPEKGYQLPALPMEEPSASTSASSSSSSLPP